MKKTIKQMLNHFHFRNLIAEFMHDVWCEWSKELASEEQISPHRQKRWKSQWIPFDQLDEETKEIDRKYSDRMLAVLKRYFVEVSRGL